MPTLNLKFAAIPGIVLNEAYTFEFNSSSRQIDNNFHNNLIDLALDFNETKINRKDIISIRTKLEKNLVYESTYFHTGKNKLTDIHFEIKTKNKYQNHKVHIISVPLNQLINKTLNTRNDRNKVFRWSFGIIVFSYMFSFLGNMILNSKVAGTAIVAVVNAYFLFDLIRHQTKLKKMENILLTIVSLEKGIEAAERAQKVIEKSVKPKRKKNS